MEDIDLRAQILDAKDIAEEEITIPEWGNVTLLIRELSGAERSFVLNKSIQKDGMPDLTVLYPLLVVKSLRYPKTHKKHGDHVFKLSDRDAISEKSGTVIERIALLAMRLSGMDQQTRANMGKNSESTQNEDSTSS